MVPSGVRLQFLDLASRLSDGVSGDCLDANEVRLSRRYSSLEAWPYDAQLALHLVSWVIGPGFNLPRFRQAVCGRLVPDFELAASECRIPLRMKHSGVASLNGWVSRLFGNAAVVIDRDMPGDRVYFPLDLSRMVGRAGSR
jgi:hypothetical protein